MRKILASVFTLMFIALLAVSCSSINNERGVANDKNVKNEEWRTYFEKYEQDDRY